MRVLESGLGVQSWSPGLEPGLGTRAWNPGLEFGLGVSPDLQSGLGVSLGFESVWACSLTCSPELKYPLGSLGLGLGVEVKSGVQTWSPDFQCGLGCLDLSSGVRTRSLEYELGSLPYRPGVQA